MMKPPTPTKTPLGFPVRLDELEHYVHYHHPDLAEPFRYEGATFVGNGALFVRLDRYHGDDPEENPGNSRFFHDLPWSRFDTMPPDNGRWRLLDDAALLLWRRGPRRLWLPPRGPFQGYSMWCLPAVRVGAAAVAPLSVVQLLARLPRAAVWIDNRAMDDIFCRFNGGVAIARSLYSEEWTRRGHTEHLNASFAILKPATCPTTGRYLYDDEPLRPAPTWTNPAMANWPPPEPID